MSIRTINRTPAQWAIFNANSQLKRLASKGRIQRPPLKQHITVTRLDGSRIEMTRAVNVDRPDVAPVVSLIDVPAAVVVAPEGGPQERRTVVRPQVASAALPEAVPVVPAVDVTTPSVVPATVPEAPEVSSTAVTAPVTTSAGRPTVTYRTSDGKPVVIVSLLGKHALGQHICLEPADWARVSRDHGTRWSLQSDGKACGYVRGGKGGRLHLARLVMEAKLGEMVEFQHRRKVGKLTVGLDFRRDNLEVGPALPQRKL